METRSLEICQLRLATITSADLPGFTGVASDIGARERVTGFSGDSVSAVVVEAEKRLPMDGGLWGDGSMRVGWGVSGVNS